MLDIWQVQIQAEARTVGGLRTFRGRYGESGGQDRTDTQYEMCSVMDGVLSVDVAAVADLDLVPEEDKHLADLPPERLTDPTWLTQRAPQILPEDS